MHAGLLTLIYAPDQPPLTVGAKELPAALGRGEVLVMVGHTLAHVLGGPGAGWEACPHRVDPPPPQPPAADADGSDSYAPAPGRRSFAFKLRADPLAPLAPWPPPTPSTAAFACVSELLEDFRASHLSTAAPGRSPPEFEVQVTWTETGGDGSRQAVEAGAGGGSLARSTLLSVRPDTPVLSLGG